MKLAFNSVLSKFNESPLWGLHLMVPIDIAKKLITKKDRRVICHINDEFTFHCALMPDGEGGFFIMLNKEFKKKSRLDIGEPLKVKLEKDTSEYGMPMPEELGELLVMDELGSKYFHALTPGKQRSLIHLVAKNKRIETRINKALVIVDYLKNAKGDLDYKELNQAFKNHNSI